MSATADFFFLLASRCPVVLAPMAGITDRAFRLVVREGGACLCWTEMLPAPALARSPRARVEFLDFLGEQGVVAQLFGADPEEMGEAALVVEAAGAVAVDLNMGCPVEEVVKTGAGAALLRELLRAAAMVEAVRRRVRVPVTVKLRKGWDEGSPTAWEIARLLEEAGAGALVVHGRYRHEFFGGRADWEAIRKVKEAVKIPVIGNGDVRTPEDALRMLASTGCDGVMVGRAARGNPWIFSRCQLFYLSGQIPPPPSPAERVAQGLKHLALLQALHGDRALNRGRMVVDWYTRGLPGASALRDRAYQARDFATLRSFLERYLHRMQMC
ncbi:tRNA dihydrouridine synthase DusB [Desulfothermobacter acidiphilus]|uniref:tRNA dihydrouridine synthase DusB n=1 Tax=Desulfothermobacter acidiphilus TaxID=1938353 RepID=UPI003F8AF13B